MVEKVAATTPYREETSTNEAQSPPNPQKRISGKQRKAKLEEYQQTFLQIPRIDDRKPVFVRLRSLPVGFLTPFILSCSCTFVIRYTVYSWYTHFLRPLGAIVEEVAATTH